MRTFTAGCLLLTMTLLLVACASQRPVLYPNDHLKQVGQPQAERDIDACIQMATEYKANADRSREIATDTGKAAVVGGATGAVVGAIAGDAGIGAAIGAAGAGTATLGAALFQADEPDPIFRQFVDQCLREKGYQTLGWR